MYDRLYSFLVKYSMLYSFQFGFRKAHSTYMALTCLLDKLHNALERGENAIGIFIDFRKAFDTVHHGILLYKLYHYWVRGAAYDWFCDYLKIERSWSLITIFNQTMQIFHVGFHRDPF